MPEEIIVCDSCNGEHCTVDEIIETKKISMNEYASRGAFPDSIWDIGSNGRRTQRHFCITCQDCGHQVEFIERIVRETDG